MAFEVIKDKDDANCKKLPVSSFTGTKGDLIERTAGSTTWQACTASSDFFTVKAILMESCVSASTVLAYRLSGMETVRVDANASSSVTHNGDRMTLTTTAVVANTGSDVTGQAVSFVQEDIVGAATAKKIIGRVLVGNGVDPDAS